MPDLIPPVELSQYGRKLIVGIFLILFLILAIGIGGYIYFSETIPTHFGFSEKPDAFGSKVYLVIIAIILSLTLLFIMLIGLFCKRIKNFPPFVIYKRTHIIKFLKQNSSNLGILFRCFVSSV